MVVATTILEKDDVIVEFCLSKGIEYFRGSEDNVLERYYLCAQKYNFNNIVRLTGDNPFTDTGELDNLITLHLNSMSDYSHSLGSLPIGVGAEIFHLMTLRKVIIAGLRRIRRNMLMSIFRSILSLFTLCAKRYAGFIYA